jgi:phage shock protein C
MFCTKCGVQLEERDHFCYECGTVTGNAPSPVVRRKLTRSIINKRVAGVCGGLAEHIDADPVIVRLLWVVLSLGLPPAGILGYIIAWIIIPKADPVTYAYLSTPPIPATPRA